MYNTLFGKNPASEIVLAILKSEGLDDIPRFRDAYIEENEAKGYYFVIMTRTGGGNREDYEIENDAMAAHPLYVEDHDDGFDVTYAYFKFRVPEKYLPLVTAIYEKTGKTPELSDKFGEKLDEIKNMTPEQLRQQFPEICSVLDKVKERVEG